MKKYLNLHSLIILIILFVILFNVFNGYQFQRGQKSAEVVISPFTGAVDFEGYSYSVKESLTREPLSLTPHHYETRIHDRYKYETFIDKYLNQSGSLIQGSLLDQLDVLNIYDTYDSIYLNIGPRSFDNSNLNRDNIYYFIMSLVNSVTENNRHQSVHILVNGDLSREKYYDLDFSQPFYRDERIVEIDAEYLLTLLRKMQKNLEDGNITQAKNHFTFELGKVEDPRFVEELNIILNRFPIQEIQSMTFDVSEGYRKLTTSFVRDGEQEKLVWNFRFQNNILKIDYYRTIVNNLE